MANRAGMKQQTTALAPSRLVLVAASVVAAIAVLRAPRVVLGEPDSLSSDRQSQSIPADVQPFIAAAAKAFESEDIDRGTALIAAALVQAPGNLDALRVYEKVLKQRLDTAIANADWDAAGIQVAAYDQIIRDGLRGARSVADVDKLLAFSRRVDDWGAQIDQAQAAAVREVLALVKQDLQQPNPNYESLAATLIELPLDQLPEDLAEEVAAVSTAISAARARSRLERMKTDIESLQAEARAPALSPIALQALRARADALLSEWFSNQAANAALTAEPLESLREIISQLDERLQVDAIRRVQTIADADAIQLVEHAKQLLLNATKPESQKDSPTFQQRGELLAQAEVLLSRVDQLCSAQVRQDTQILLQQLRKHAVVYRVLQQKAYNQWAVAVLEEALALYQDGKGWVYDNEGRFRRVLRDKVGQIDPSLLHPAVYALYSDMFHRLMKELVPKQQAVITADILKSKHKELSEF